MRHIFYYQVPHNSEFEALPAAIALCKYIFFSSNNSSISLEVGCIFSQGEIIRLWVIKLFSINLINNMIIIALRCIL